MTTLIEIGSGAYGRVYYDITTGYCVKQSKLNHCNFIQEAEAQMLAAKVFITCLKKRWKDILEL